MRLDSAAETPRTRIGLVVTTMLLGTALGVGTYTFLYADGAAYLHNDPAACGNCHVMQSHLNAWHKSTHKHVATCNDCHAPHTTIAAKYFVKGVNGFRHSVAFTSGRFPEPIRITDFNRKVTEAACRYCHEDMVHAIDPIASGEVRIACIRCHGDVGHPR